MLMALGLFVFELKSLPFDTRSRSTNWRWSSNNRLGVRPAYQHLGPGEDQITLRGTLTPEVTGGSQQLSDLRDMADQGKSWVLMHGDGRPQGFWFIENIEETASHLFPDGSARKIEFSVQLKRAPDGEPDTVGDLTTINAVGIVGNIA